MGYAVIQLTPRIIEQLLTTGYLASSWQPQAVKVRRFSVKDEIGHCGVAEVFIEDENLYELSEFSEVPRIPVDFNKAPTIKHINYSSTELCEV